jgi:aspartyl protease family protein
MDPDATARLLYLVLLGVFLIFVLSRTGLRLAGALRTLVIWGAILAAVAIGYSLVVGDSGRSTTGMVAVRGDTVVLQRGADGHFHADLAVNGTPVRFMVDTGATDIVLRPEDAEAAGIDTANLVYLGRAMTANGMVRTAPVRLRSLGLGERVDTDVRATVTEGEMPVSLLGMAYLDRFERVEIAGGELRLVP